MSVFCPCGEMRNLIEVRGRMVTVIVAAAAVVRWVRTVCVKCVLAHLDDGTVAPVTMNERRSLLDVARRVAYARDAIARKIDVDRSQLPTVEQLSELGHMKTIRSDAFETFTRTSTDEEIRRHFRGLFNIPDGEAGVVVGVPGLRRGIIVGPKFVEHPFEKQRRRDDPDHVNWAIVTPQTIVSSVEIFRARMSGSYVFLGAYRDLSIPDGARGQFVYHVAYALRDGRLDTSFRLTGGAQAFRQERAGRLLFAAYATDAPAIVLPRRHERSVSCDNMGGIAKPIDFIAQKLH